MADDLQSLARRQFDEWRLRDGWMFGAADDAWEIWRAAQAVPAWQPISTAPKDGTHILVWTDVSDTAYVVCWADSEKGIRTYLTAESCTERGWHLAWDGELFDREYAPTHWMHLPSAPGATLAAQEQKPEHIPTTSEHAAMVDAALGLVALPPIRVSHATHAALVEAAKARGVILQALVRERLAPYVVPQASPAPAGEREAFRAYLSDCDDCAIVPDAAGAFHWAWQHRSAPLAGTPRHEGGGEGLAESWPESTQDAKSSPTPTGGEGRGVEVSGLAADGSQDAGATAEMPREGKVNSSGLTAEGYEASATSATPGEQLDDAPVPEPADWHFNRMLQQLGRNPA